MLAFFIGISVVAVSVAVRFLLLGAWVVLPFAMVELIGLGIAFFLMSRRSRYSETIDVAEDALFVIRRDWRSQHEWRFQPYWVQVILRLDANNWYPSRLFLRSHGQSIEIGSCLTDEERAELSAGLRHRLEQNRSKTY
jgi:uncharacterized membrane protein